MPDAIASDPTELAAAWQSVVATETPAAEQAAMEAFWQNHIGGTSTPLSLALSNAETGTSMAINDFDAEQPEAHMVRITIGESVFDYRPKSAEAFDILLRE